MTRSETATADLAALLKARNTLIWIRTREEVRTRRAILDAAAVARYPVKFWDIASGASWIDDAGKEQADPKLANSPKAVLDKIRDSEDRALWVLLDFHPFVKAPVEQRALRNLAIKLQSAEVGKSRSIIILSASSEIPVELSAHTTVLEWPLPDRTEVAALLDTAVAPYPKVQAKLTNGTRDAAIDAAVGLTEEEASACYAKSLVTHRGIDATAVAAEKKRIISREGVLEWSDPDPRGLAAIGGLDHLKAWLVQRKAAFSQKARDFGLPSPKGMLLVGPPGCLAAGTRIGYKRGQRNSSRSLPIEVFYSKFNGIEIGKGYGHEYGAPKWLPDLDTYLQSWDQGGSIVFNKVTAVIASGEKDCIRISTDAAGEVELTADHPILLEDGTFRAAGDLVTGDRLLVRGSMKPATLSTSRARTYAKRIVVEGLKYHPMAWKKTVKDQKTGKVYEYQRTTRARLVVEAYMNKIPYEEFVQILKSDPERAETLAFLPAEYDVHHLDENPVNDVIENLAVMPHGEHARHHGDDALEHFKVEHTAIVVVTSKVSIGRRPTFDISMAEPFNNFVVNDGIIVHNCGKSLSAKATAAAWGMPLLKLDMGALKSKWVGESEKNIRKALAVAEAVAPCVLWCDEIEKAIGGATSGAADGGVSVDALGVVLTWLQERKSSVFVVATSNDISQLPPELLRKGRFDQIFFVDLPTRAEREEVLRVALAEHKRGSDGIDLAALADATEGFSGSEVASLVPDALFAAFADKERALATADLLAVKDEVVPLSVTAGEKVAVVRKWAKEGRARFASKPEERTATMGGRKLDLDEEDMGGGNEGAN